jgi:hypothetical protein
MKLRKTSASADCKACHQKAEQGIYQDDDVVMPSK